MCSIPAQRKRFGSRVAGLTLALTVAGCATSYYESYRAHYPGWRADVPALGGPLHEVLALVTAPAPTGFVWTVSDLDVLRVDYTGVTQRLGPNAVRSEVAAPSPGTIGVVARVRCHAIREETSYKDQKTSWFLIRDGRLVAWDSYRFVDRCLAVNEFLPAVPEDVEFERLLRRQRDDRLPNSDPPLGQYYANGLAYLRVGRYEAARRMLTWGDGSIEVGTRDRGVVLERDSVQRVRYRRVEEVDDLRRKLSVALEARGRNAPEATAWMGRGEMVAHIDAEESAGRRPLRIEGRAGGDSGQFRASFVPTPPAPFDYRYSLGVTRGELASEDRTLAQEGFRRVFVDQFVGADGQPRYQPIWVR